MVRVQGVTPASTLRVPEDPRRTEVPSSMESGRMRGPDNLNFSTAQPRPSPGFVSPPGTPQPFASSPPNSPGAPWSSLHGRCLSHRRCCGSRRNRLPGQQPLRAPADRRTTGGATGTQGGPRPARRVRGLESPPALGEARRPEPQRRIPPRGCHGHQRARVRGPVQRLRTLPRGPTGVQRRGPSGSSRSARGVARDVRRGARGDGTASGDV